MIVKVDVRASLYGPEMGCSNDTRFKTSHVHNTNSFQTYLNLAQEQRVIPYYKKVESSKGYATHSEIWRDLIYTSLLYTTLLRFELSTSHLTCLARRNSFWLVSLERLINLTLP